MPGARTIHCVVITPEARVLDEGVLSLILPAHDGLLGVLPAHAPLICQLGPGLLHYTTADQVRHVLLLNGGFAHLGHDELVILTPQAVTRAQASAAFAEQELLDARALPAHSFQEAEARRQALARARQLVKLAEMRD